MVEIDSICSQIGPMIEALKLLTSDATVDLNQTENLNNSTIKEDFMAYFSNNEAAEKEQQNQ